MKNLNFLLTFVEILDLIMFLKSSECNTANSTCRLLIAIDANLGALFIIPSSPKILPLVKEATI